VDGSAGLMDGGDALPTGDREWWDGYRDRLEQVAQQAGRPPHLREELV
jgi:hypothetical protein